MARQFGRTAASSFIAEPKPRPSAQWADAAARADNEKGPAVTGGVIGVAGPSVRVIAPPDRRLSSWGPWRGPSRIIATRR